MAKCEGNYVTWTALYCVWRKCNIVSSTKLVRRADFVVFVVPKQKACTQIYNWSECREIVCWSNSIISVYVWQIESMYTVAVSYIYIYIMNVHTFLICWTVEHSVERVGTWITYIICLQIGMIGLKTIVQNGYDNTFASHIFTPCRNHIHVQSVATMLLGNRTKRNY